MKVKIAKEFNRESKRLYKKYASLAKEVLNLIHLLEKEPFQGKPLGRNCYKIRLKIASKNTGKSGGGRIITNIAIEKDTLTLLAIYDKSEQDDISDAEIARRLKELPE
jgi:mRNA-degrading endonuclease RelE of RelBE toxin-antitoxin system